MNHSESHVSERWRRGPWQASVLLVGALSVVASGYFGYRAYLGDVSALDAAFYSLNLLALGFYPSPDGAPVPPALQFARFGAHVLAGLGLALAFATILRRQTERWRGVRSQNHVVVIGENDHAVDVAIAYSSFRERKASRGSTLVSRVCIVGEFGDATTDMLRRHRIRVVDGIDDSTLGRLLDGASRVIVTAGTDPKVMHWWSRLVRIGAHRSSSVQLIVEDPQFAAELRRLASDTADHGVDICCTVERLAQIVLRRHPPRRDGHISPPPIVIGDGVLAREIVRSMALGWEMPGLPLEIRCLTEDPSWVLPLERDLGGRARLVAVCTGGGPSHVNAVCRAVDEHVTGWKSEAVALQRRKLGDSLIVIGGPDDAATFTLQHAIARTLQSGCVVAICDDALEQYSHSTCATEVVVYDRREMLTNPAVLEEDVVSRLARTLDNERRYWPNESPSVFDRLGPAAEAPLADAILRASSAAGLVPGEQQTPLILTPGELRTIVDRLVAELDISRGDEEEHDVWYSFAATIPTLLARVGHSVTKHSSATEPRLRDDDIENLARAVHQHYQERTTSGSATGSTLREQTWEFLSEFHKESNRAQVRDIPVKLAATGFRLTAEDPTKPTDVSWLTDDVVKRLAHLEHCRWTRLHLAADYHFGPETDHANRLHPMLRPWAALSVAEQELDCAPVRHMPRLLAEVGLCVTPI